MSYYLWTNVRHIAQYVRRVGKTSPDATYYSEHRKMNNLDTTMIETALLASELLMLGV
jgi:hypothetical protein